MKKNRFLALALSLLMALALPLGAFAEENEPDTLLEGLVTEVLEQGFVMEDIELGSVLLNVDETTVMDGILAEGDIEVGQYVFVEYDGRLTRSLPPQAHADRVGCYRLTGTVDLSPSMGVLLTGDPTFGDVIIRVDGSMPHLYQGMPITVYYNPPHRGARAHRRGQRPRQRRLHPDRRRGERIPCAAFRANLHRRVVRLGGGCARRGGCGAGGRRGGRNHGECRNDC